MTLLMFQVICKTVFSLFLSLFSVLVSIVIAVVTGYAFDVTNPIVL